MDLILTSFGVSHLQDHYEADTDVFYRMPPACLAGAGQEFMPDYASLLIADRIVIDQTTYDLLLADRNAPYRSVADVLRALHGEGFIRLEEFDSVISRHRPLLCSMLERDMKELDSWVKPLSESLSEWLRFVNGFRGPLLGDFLDTETKNRSNMWLHQNMQHSQYVRFLVSQALRSSHMRREFEHRTALRKVLTEYLSHVNANLLLSNQLDGCLYDWCDFRPFYHDKFLRLAQPSSPGESETESIRKLFEVSFPEFSFWTPKSIVRVLKDKRIVELRKLVASAANGDTVFDREFAVRVLEEVLVLEKSIGKLRTFVSYATLPLGLIPWVGDIVQKVAEEAVVQAVVRKRTKDYGWFYLISDAHEIAQRELRR